MLLNRLGERVWDVRRATRELAQRAGRQKRLPVIVVPSILGSRLVDDRGELVWGSLGRLYQGPPLERAVEPAGELGEFSLIDGLVVYDVFGGLIRFLERVGGYRRDRDLHVLAYDWRLGIAHAARALGTLIDQVVADAGRVDVVCVSTGGLGVRHALRDRVRAGGVGRVVYIGTPHRGSFSSVWYLVDGVQPAPFGRRFSARDVGALQTAWDALPHPGERVFVDGAGRALHLDHYDGETWRTLGIAHDRADLDERLAAARASWRELDACHTPQPPAFVIGGRHVATIGRSVVERGIARIPPCTPPRFRRSVPGIYEPGDSSVSVTSLCAAPNLTRARFVTPSEHRLLPADREVHHAVLEALLARIPA